MEKEPRHDTAVPPLSTFMRSRNYTNLYATCYLVAWALEPNM